MGEDFDRISRILATPMPRKTAVRLILGGIGGAILAPLGFGQRIPQRQMCTPDPAHPRGGAGCPPGKKCCPGGNACCAAPLHCCGTFCCPPPKACVNGVCARRRATRNRP